MTPSPAGVAAHVGLAFSVDTAAIALLAYIRSLADRIPDQPMRRRLTIAMWGYGAASAPYYVRGVCLVGTTALHDPVSSVTAFGLVIGVLTACVLLPVKLGFLTWLLILLARVHRTFSRALAVAIGVGRTG